MSAWTIVDSSHDNEICRRPLGLTELGFHWDGAFAGTGDTLQHVEADVDPQQASLIFSVENVERTWVYLKRRFPLLGSTLVEREGSDGADFVVQERRLRCIDADEVTFRDVNTQREAEAFIETIINGPRQLSSNLLSRIYILPRRDRKHRYHVLTHVAHVITDGLANAVILRVFFDVLCSQPDDVFPSLVERLRFVVPLEHFFPNLRLSVQRRRWRHAMAYVLFNLRQAKLQGGHTLPRAITPRTAHTPAHSRLTMLHLPADTSSHIIASCRKAGITFGHAFPVIAQLAHARILHRLHFRGALSDAAWEARKLQPMNFEGPLNLRPYLCPELYSAASAGAVSVFTSTFTNALPFMPTAEFAPGRWRDGAPAFAELLSKERFFLRSRVIKRQSADFMKHPLFLELAALKNVDRTVGLKEVALQWRHEQARGGVAYSEDTLFPDIPKPSSAGIVFANCGSSMGNLDDIFPSYYPRPDPSKPAQKPIIHAKLSTNRLRCRPTELYLGAYQTGQRMALFVFWDGNVYEEALVNEWLAEVRKATEWYLGMEELPVDYPSPEMYKARL